MSRNDSPIQPPPQADDEAFARLARRIAELEGQGSAEDDIRALQDELAGLTRAFDQLRQYATVDLKQQVADYMNAMAAVARLGDSGTPARGLKDG